MILVSHRSPNKPDNSGMRVAKYMPRSASKRISPLTRRRSQRIRTALRALLPGQGGFAPIGGKIAEADQRE